MTRTADEPLRRYRRVRSRTESLIEGMTVEDMGGQAMPLASPAKWHVAHTTWFFETFLLGVFVPAYRSSEPAYRTLFNSYYDAVGPRPQQADRHLFTRPGLAQVMDWRRRVDEAMAVLLSGEPSPEVLATLDLGLAHEEQHQELILTDGLALFAANPLEPAWKAAPEMPKRIAPPLKWFGHEGGLHEIGAGGDGFAFDNERPRHEVYLRPYSLASRLVTCGEWLAFMADGGYRRPTLWQQDGWLVAQREGWYAPWEWEFRDGRWTAMTLCGRRPLDEHMPVCQISWYEADAYARWFGARLPSEAEWEVAARTVPASGNLLESGYFQPLAAPGGNGGLLQMFGDVWEWTADAHRPYPGWRPLAGAFGEYNGKFMAGRMVLRGGSFATPAPGIRASVRNFWQPETRWQFSGLRLAEDA